MVKKAKKGPTIFIESAHLKPFGLQMHDLVRSPVGMVGSVIGVKYATADNAANFVGGKLWVKYESGLEAPVDWVPEHGYAKCSVAEHIKRDVGDHLECVAAMEEERKRIEEANRLRALGIEVPAKAEKKSGGGKKTKKK